MSHPSFGQWKDKVAGLLRSWGWSTRRIFYGIKWEGRCNQRYNENWTAEDYARFIDNKAPLDLLPEEHA